MNSVSDAFGKTYAEARDKFVTAAKARGLELESHVLRGRDGAEGETLASDVARLGPRGAERVVIVTSGTHGVEGFCGSGCQVNLLRDDLTVATAEKLGVAVLFYHAVNPYGFSHVRRVNEDNVDLNRNFLDFSQPLRRNDAYAEVHGFMLPSHWPPDATAQAALGSYMQTRGPAALQSALTGGQSDFPDGMFYAGRAPTWSNVTVRNVLREHLRDARRVAWIDIHTALGPWGHGEKIYAGRDDAATLNRTRAIFGADVTSFYDGSSASAEVSGIVCHSALDEAPGIEYSGIGLEFGTQPLEVVLDALRADHWLAAHPDAPGGQRAAIHRRMREVFFDESPQWQAMVVGQSRVAALQALKGLAS
ncbi:MAG TPA: M14 family metallopeptidase [Casimicrobiaceae bacterium]|jgi:hypothetical protein